MHYSDLATLVDADWHDSWEATGEMVVDWWGSVLQSLEAVMDIGVVQGVAMDKCHEVRSSQPLERYLIARKELTLAFHVGSDGRH